MEQFKLLSKSVRGMAMTFDGAYCQVCFVDEVDPVLYKVPQKGLIVEVLLKELDRVMPSLAKISSGYNKVLGDIVEEARTCQIRHELTQFIEFFLAIDLETQLSDEQLKKARYINQELIGLHDLCKYIDIVVVVRRYVREQKDLQLASLNDKASGLIHLARGINCSAFSKFLVTISEVCEQLS